MGYSSEVTIIIQQSDRGKTNALIQKEIEHVNKIDTPDECYAKEVEERENKWAMFLGEVAVKPETELAWREISSGISEESFNGFGDTLELDKEKRRIMIGFSDVKWYEGYDNTDSYMALFHSVKPYEDYIDAIYLRIGEDMDDLEEKAYGNGYDLAGINRLVEIF